MIWLCWNHLGGQSNKKLFKENETRESALHKELCETETGIHT